VEPETRRGGHERILVVDDEEALVRLFTESLTELGYTTVSFTASAAALDAFLADPVRFDAVITDQSMPGTSGTELIRKVRALRPTIPILLVSGYLSTELLQQAQEAGATEVLKKPLSAHQLATSLARVLQATQAPRAKEIPRSALPRRAPRERRPAMASPSRTRPTRRG
jgi:CheY-like chemotaxis protein